MMTTWARFKKAVWDFVENVLAVLYILLWIFLVAFLFF